MKIIKAGFEILTKTTGIEILKDIERAGRTCYKSEDKITDESAVEFVRKLIKRGHEAMIEHASITVKVVCDRGVSHEIVRHRLASYAQESTRYCDYTKGKDGKPHITVILPEWMNASIEGIYDIEWDGLLGLCSQDPTIPHSPESHWFWNMAIAERDYFKLRELGWQPQQARSVLPNSLKTEIIITMNGREWRHFFKMRADKAAHPQMQEIAYPLLEEFWRRYPVLFDDLREAKII